MGEMMERVADALTEALERNLANNAINSQDLARTALEAIREPTEAMRNVYAGPLVNGHFPTKEDMWRAMVDAALDRPHTDTPVLSPMAATYERMARALCVAAGEEPDRYSAGSEAGALRNWERRLPEAHAITKG